MQIGTFRLTCQNTKHTTATKLRKPRFPYSYSTKDTRVQVRERKAKYVVQGTANKVRKQANENRKPQLRNRVDNKTVKQTRNETNKTRCLITEGAVSFQQQVLLLA